MTVNTSQQAGCLDSALLAGLGWCDGCCCSCFLSGDPSHCGVPPGRGVGLQQQREGAVHSVLLFVRRRSAAVPQPLPASPVSSCSARSHSGWESRFSCCSFSTFGLINKKWLISVIRGSHTAAYSLTKKSNRAKNSLAVNNRQLRSYFSLVWTV